MPDLLSIQNHFVHSGLNGLLWTLIFGIVVNFLSLGIPDKVYESLESNSPRAANLLRLSRVLGWHLRKIAPVIVCIILGRKWEPNGPIAKAVEAIEKELGVPPPTPETAPTPEPKTQQDAVPSVAPPSDPIEAEKKARTGLFKGYL